MSSGAYGSIPIRPSAISRRIVRSERTTSRFYEDVLGMRVVGEGESWIHFDLGTGPDFELIRRSTEPQYDRARYQVGFAVDDIEAAQKRLREMVLWRAREAPATTALMVKCNCPAIWARGSQA